MYLKALFITLISEGAVASLLSTKGKKKALLGSFLINFITHPIAYFAFMRTGNFVLVELGVITTEFLFWKIPLRNTTKKSFLIAATTNLVSMFLGAIWL